MSKMFNVPKVGTLISISSHEIVWFGIDPQETRRMFLEDEEMIPVGIVIGYIAIKDHDRKKAHQEGVHYIAMMTHRGIGHFYTRIDINELCDHNAI